MPIYIKWKNPNSFLTSIQAKKTQKKTQKIKKGN
ncbi:hypothetical protein Y592_01350 [Thermosipho sp. 1070]|nr:hypothetical protein Y592_01350 [Thermosipho sp. 1070]